MKQKFFLLLFIAFSPIHALKLDRVILATDANQDYIQFWPIVSKAWKEIIGVRPTLALIADDDISIDESLGDVLRFKPIEGIPTSLQAQAIRLLLPACFPDDVCIISDIDMIPLSRDYFVNSISDLPEDVFAVYRDGAYAPHELKFPMCYVAAKGSVFREIFQVTDSSDFGAIISAWHALGLGWNTDELVMYHYLTQWPAANTKCILLGHGVERRIDRSYWAYNVDFLNRGYYIDAHCPRPYSTYKKHIDALLKKPRLMIDAGCGTHIFCLSTAVMNTDGPILEMGSGDFSTPLLHALCATHKRFLLTTDTDKKWLGYFEDLQTEWHHFEYVPVYDDDWSLNPKPWQWDNVARDTHWAVVFIDHRPGERRIEDIQRLRDHTDIFVIHDTETASYGYGPLLSTFKYIYVDRRYTTYTTVASDTIDVSQFFQTT